MAHCLILNTTFQGISVAIGAFSKSPQLLCCEHNLEARASSAEIMAILDRSLLTLGLTVKDLRALIVASGPGSFTGIKIGLAFAYGLVRGSEGRLMVAGVSGLQAFYKQQMETHAAKPEAGYVLPITKTHGFMVYPAGLNLFSLDELLMHESLKTFFLLKPWPELLQKQLESRKTIVELELSQVCEQTICGMWEKANNLWPDGFSSDLPQPLYLRKSTAEEKLKGGLS